MHRLCAVFSFFFLLTIFLRLTFFPPLCCFSYKASPFPPHSDLFSTTDLVDNSNQQFARPTVDVSGAYYGAFPNHGYENMISPVSAKRSRDGFDEILTDTLGSFALEAKKKRLDPSYNEGKNPKIKRIVIFKKKTPLISPSLSNSTLAFSALFEHDTSLGGCGMTCFFVVCVTRADLVCLLVVAFRYDGTFECAFGYLGS